MRGVHEAMDMTTGLKYTEVYTDKNSDVWGCGAPTAWRRSCQGYEARPTSSISCCAQQKQGEHGKAFALQDRQFRRAGLDQPARQRHDAVRSARPSGSGRRWARRRTRIITSTASAPKAAAAGCRPRLRDLARFGETIRNHGRFNGRQIVPSQWSRTSPRGGDPEKFKPAGYTTLPGASYRNQWWVTHNAHGAFMARGVHGQGIYIDPKAEMVIARYASHPAAGNAANDPVTLPAYMALAKDLDGRRTGRAGERRISGRSRASQSRGSLRSCPARLTARSFLEPLDQALPLRTATAA